MSIIRPFICYSYGLINLYDEKMKFDSYEKLSSLGKIRFEYTTKSDIIRLKRVSSTSHKLIPRLLTLQATR